MQEDDSPDMPRESASAADAPAGRAPGPDPGRRAGWKRADWFFAAGLGLLSLVSRIPFRSRFLNTWDSVLFALATQHYSVPEARPHPPGYPVYVALGWLAERIWPDPNTALVVVSLLFAAGCVVALYVLVRLFTCRRAAVIAASLFALSPVLLYNGVIATTYAGEAFFSILLAAQAWRARHGTLRSSAVLGAIFGLALGYRASLLFFLAPLAAWALWPGASRAAPPTAAPAWKVALQRTGVAGAAAATIGLVWAVPMVILSGGLRPYMAATSLQSQMVVFSQSVFQLGRAAWDDHWKRFLLYVDAERTILLPAAVLLVGAGLLLHRGLMPWLRSARPERGAVTWFLLWLVPPVAFYLLVFDGWGTGPDGYILCVLPAVYLLFAMLIEMVLRGVDDRLWSAKPPAPRDAAPVRFVVPLVLVVLLALPSVALAARWPDTYAKDVKEHDAWVEDWLALSGTFPPEHTGIVASYSWANVKWYYPEYTVWSHMRVPGGPTGSWALFLETHQHQDDTPFYVAHERGPVPTHHAIAPGITRIILFDFQLAGENGEASALATNVTAHEAHLSNGWRVLYVDVDPTRPNIEDYFHDAP